MMKATGIKNLKARLSEYLRLVKSGERVLVTEHDQVIAEIVPAQHESPVTKNIEDLFLKLAELGEVSLRSAEKIDLTIARMPLSQAITVSTKTLLDELRAE
jgi:antitoxin (DNA-binding transcriptional repressor) of toxin-antitoxin stability system